MCILSACLPRAPSHPGRASLTQHLLPSRVQSLQLHRELDLAHLGASTDLNDGRARRRAWQQRLNGQIQRLTLQLLVSIFRYFPHPSLGLLPEGSDQGRRRAM